MNKYDEAERLCNEGLDLMLQTEYEQAQGKFLEAITNDNTSRELWFQLGKAYAFNDQHFKAITALDEAIKRDKDYVEAYALKGSCFAATNNHNQAIFQFATARDMAQYTFGNKEAAASYEFALAHVHLALGDFKKGFELYQSRVMPEETWDGKEALAGRRLHVMGEGGLGDQIFYSRYSRYLESLNGRVILHVDGALVRYISNNTILPIYNKDKTNGPKEDALKVNMMSLPYIFGTKPGTIPVLGAGIVSISPIRRIGIAWSGNPLFLEDSKRSIPFEKMLPLVNSLPIEWVSLQKDIRYTDEQSFAKSVVKRVEVEDVEDLAEIVRSCDLVITVDTMAAHLAGSEGVPTWLLVPYSCDWRWGIEGETTPWYPSVRIFRQGNDRQWEPVIQKVIEELRNVGDM